MLWEVESLEEYRKRVQGICTIYFDFKLWFKSKQKPWIVSALVQSKSYILGVNWVYVKENINIAESTYFKENNAIGRRFILFNVILQ